MKKIIFILFCLTSNIACANAFYTGDQLLPMCQGYLRVLDQTSNDVADDSIAGSICLGYIQGVVDAETDFLQFKNPKAYKALSEQTGISGDQLVRMTVNFLTKNPNILNYSASSLITTMLFQQFNLPTK